MLSSKAPARLRTLIANTTGYSTKEFPVKYLGLPLISGRCKKAFFSAIVDKIKILRKVKGWRSSLLSAGGRLILIKHVLSAIPIYTLASTAIQKGIHSLIEKHFSNFFWCSNEGKNKKHWRSWASICRPTEVGGLGVMYLRQIKRALRAKLLWRGITKDSLWAQFFQAKHGSVLWDLQWQSISSARKKQKEKRLVDG